MWFIFFQVWGGLVGKASEGRPVIGRRSLLGMIFPNLASE